jgi:hypothetical protein
VVHNELRLALEQVEQANRSVRPSNLYCLSIATIGSRRRAALTSSRSRVSSFSRASSVLRAASHSSRDTTSGRFLIAIAPLHAIVAVTTALQQ